MELWDINPYVRFARIQRKSNLRTSIVALDHRIFYCLSGEDEVKMGGTVYRPREGSLIFLRAGVPYTYVSENTTPVYLACNFDFLLSKNNIGAPIPPVHERNYTPEMLVEPDLHESLGFLPDVLYIPFVPIKETFEEIIREYTDKELFYEERCSALLKDVLIYISRLISVGERVPQKNETDTILTYIREHYSENLTNSDLAKRFSYHPNYISQLVKKRTGMTLHRYLLQYRIHMAIVLLQSEEYNVSETAAAVGFADVKHFSKCFRQITGSVPSSYLVK